jgi:hypothetical protein
MASTQHDSGTSKKSGEFESPGKEIIDNLCM